MNAAGSLLIFRGPFLSPIACVFEMSFLIRFPPSNVGITFNALHFNTTFDKIDLIMQTNLMSALYSTKILTKNMIKKQSGCIINISSMLGIKGGKGCVTYAASKAGMIGEFFWFFSADCFITSSFSRI